MKKRRKRRKRRNEKERRKERKRNRILEEELEKEEEDTFVLQGTMRERRHPSANQKAPHQEPQLQHLGLGHPSL